MGSECQHRARLDDQVPTQVRGIQNSLEWAISAAASIGIHFLDDGFGIEIYEADGPLHISGTMGQHSSASQELGDQPTDRPQAALDHHHSPRR